MLMQNLFLLLIICVFSCYSKSFIGFQNEGNFFEYDDLNGVKKPPCKFGGEVSLGNNIYGVNEDPSNDFNRFIFRPYHHHHHHHHGHLHPWTSTKLPTIETSKEPSSKEPSKPSKEPSSSTFFSTSSSMMSSTTTEIPEIDIRNSAEI